MVAGEVAAAEAAAEVADVGDDAIYPTVALQRWKGRYSNRTTAALEMTICGSRAQKMRLALDGRTTPCIFGYRGGFNMTDGACWGC